MDTPTRRLPVPGSATHSGTHSASTSISSFQNIFASNIRGERTPLLSERETEEGRNYGRTGIEEENRLGGPSSLKDPQPSAPQPPQAPTRLTLWQRAKYYVPSLAWVPQYSWLLLGGDLTAGLTLACMLVPQSVSYATGLAGLSPIAGLYAAAIPGLIYAFLGTSRQLNVAPEAALSLLIGGAVAEVIHDFEHDHKSEGGISDDQKMRIGFAVCTIITLQTGIISFLVGLFRLGFIDVVLSRALLRGFITAIALVIMIQQLIPMLGLPALPHGTSTPAQLVYLLKNWRDAHEPTAIMAFGALGVLVFIRAVKAAIGRWLEQTSNEENKRKLWRNVVWWMCRLPEVLLVVVGATAISEDLRLDERGVDILGAVPISHAGRFIRFPINRETLPYLRRTTPIAILCTIMGFLDSIVAAKQNGARYGHHVSPNRELVALGVANIGTAFVPGTLPAYGSITRSRMSGEVGGRTQMASIICSFLVLGAVWKVMGLLWWMPRCVLASIIVLVVFAILAETPHDVFYYFKMRAWTDLALMSFTFFLSVFWNIEIGIVASLVMSLILVVRRSSSVRMTVMGRIPGTERWIPIEEDPDAREEVPGVLIVRIRENLDFANTTQLKERLRRLELYGAGRSHPSEQPRRQEADVLVFHMSDVEECDATAVVIFYELLETYKSRGVMLFVTHLHSNAREMFERAGVIRLLGHDAFYDNVGEVMNRLRR